MSVRKRKRRETESVCVCRKRGRENVCWLASVPYSTCVCVCVCTKPLQVQSHRLVMQVKALHCKGHVSSPGDIPPGELAVIPVTKLATTSKVNEVIEQLRHNFVSSVPPVIDKDSLPGVPIITSMSTVPP